MKDIFVEKKIIMKTKEGKRTLDITMLKHAEIYECYKQMCAEHRQKYPEVADYIGRNYYYNILSEKFNLTRNYLCAIICNILYDEDKFYNNLAIAKMNIESDREL